MTTRLCAFVVSALLASSVQADLIVDELIENGNFTDPVALNFWTTAPNNWLLSTLNAPLGGGRHAITSNVGSGFKQLYQVITLPTLPTLVTAATLSWRDALVSLETWVDGTHEYRVVLRDSAGAELQEVFSTNSLDPNDPTVDPTNRGADMTAFVLAHLGQNIRVSFETEDNGSYIRADLDNVSFMTTFVTASVPEPSSFLLASIPAIGIFMRRRRKAATVKPGV